MKRRPKGEGALWYSAKQNRWIGQITLPNGRKKSKHGKTQGEVRKWLLEQRKAVQDGVYLTDDAHTVESFLKKYIDDVANHTLAPRTLLSYGYLIRKHIVPELGSIKLSKLRPEHLQSLYTKKLGQGLSRRTVLRIHNLLHTSLQIAYKWGLVLRNVADLAQAPRAEKTIPTILTVSQINQLLEVVKGSKFYALYLCAASLGLREGELLALEWNDVDWDKKTISVNKQIQYIPGKGVSVKHPKTRASVRVLPLPEVTLKALREHKKYATNSKIFQSDRGTYYYPRNILRHFQNALAKAGLPKIPFHNLRHSCASYHLAIGTNPKVVQALLGHSSITITLQTYSHLLPGVSEEAAENINKIFT